jgi:hypothetical protein
MMKTVCPTKPGRYLPAKYGCPRHHGGNTRLAAIRDGRRTWIWCAGCHTHFAPEELPGLLRDRI